MTEIEKKALAVVDAFCEALSSKDAEIQQAVAAEVAQIVAFIREQQEIQEAASDMAPDPENAKWYSAAGFQCDVLASVIQRGEYKPEETGGE